MVPAWRPGSSAPYPPIDHPMKPTREVSKPIVDSIGNSSSSTIAPESLTGSPFVPVGVAAVDTHHGERRLALLDQLGEPVLDTAVEHLVRVAVLAVQCDHRTQRTDLREFWPGGRAITQLVLTPPRAAETNEPVSLFGRCCCPPSRARTAREPAATSRLAARADPAGRPKPTRRRLLRWLRRPSAAPHDGSGQA